jgi:hypothetical protein
MNPQGTSFIPKRPTQGSVKKPTVRKVYILTYVSYVLFFTTMLAALGIFFYTNVLQSQLQAKKTELIDAKNKFKQEDLDAVKLLDAKLQTVEKQMNNHLSVLPVFESLEKSVSNELRLEKFSYKRDALAAPKVEVSGTGKVFNSLLFQRSILLNDSVLSGGTFEKLALNSSANEDQEQTVQNQSEDEVIKFNLEKTIPAEAIQYKPRLSLPDQNEELVDVNQSSESGVSEDVETNTVTETVESSDSDTTQ